MKQQGEVHVNELTLLRKGACILTVVFVCCLLGETHGQRIVNRVIKKYGINEGLSQAVVNGITQDYKGLMWFATDDGFNRFNGYSFDSFDFSVQGQPQFHDNFVQCILADKERNLWISSRSGLYRFDLSTEELTSYRDTTSHNNDVSFISESASGRLWIGWYWDGLAEFKRASRQYIPYTKQRLPSLSSTATIALLEDSYGLLWSGTQDNGLDVFRISEAGVPVKDDSLTVAAKLPSLYVKSLTEDHLGNIWIATTKGLVVFLRKENRFFSFSSETPIAGLPVFSLLFDSYKNLWIGTQGHGLHQVSLKDFEGRKPEKLDFVKIATLDAHDVSRHTVRSLFEDKDKNIWIGTHGDGIYMISNVERRFITFQPKKFSNGAESNISYYGLTNDADGLIWAGTDGDGIYKLDTDGTILRHYRTSANSGGITDDVVMSAYRDIEDNLWFGTYSNGLLGYDRINDKFESYVHADSKTPLGNQIRLIFQDSKKRIWVGATRGGLCVVDPETKTFRYPPGSSVSRNVDVRAIVEDKSGNFWVGCYGNGLQYYKPETDEWKVFSEGTGPDNPLKSNVVFALALDSENKLWIGTGGGGLISYDIHRETLKRYAVEDGLINNTIYGLAVDDAGKIWISTIKGLSRFDPDSEEFFNFTSFEGLQSGQFNPGSALNNLQKGYVCFGGTAGLSLFYPEHVTFASTTPKVMISGFQLFNRPVKVGNKQNGDFTLDKVIDETKRITLPSDQSVLTFQFTGINYVYPEKNRYAYKLDGIDEQWNYTHGERLATYRYLAPGQYTFMVKATNQDNVWPDDYASIEVEILPPFHKTPVAYALYAVAIGLLGYMAYRIRKRNSFLRRRLTIENNRRKRERKLVQEKLSFFTEVSHEFRTPLTLMIGPLEELLTREGTVTPTGKKLKLIYKNSFRLLHLINKLLDYRKVETGNLLLKIREDDVVHFLEEIHVTFRELAIRRKLKFTFHSEVPSIITWFDREKLEMAVNNILSNSFKYIGHGNSIEINVRRQEDKDGPARVVIEIRDNGIGIQRKDLKYIFDWFYNGNTKHPLSSGIGLALAKKLVYLHKGQISVSSVEDKGSVFTIKLPIGKEHFLPHEYVLDESAGTDVLEPNPLLIDGQASDQDEPSRKGLKSILIVEDDHEVRSFLSQYFEKEFKIYQEDNGRKGLKAANDLNPDLVISDVMMPEMNGVDLCKALKSNIKTSHIPVILLTAKTAFSHHREGLEIGADYYITKPFSPEMLGLTINNLLQSRENLKRHYRNTFITRAPEKKELASPDEHLLQRIYEILKRNLDKPDFNLDSVCEELNMSRSLLYKKIKMLTGLSPGEYVRSIKLSEAAMLLKSQQYRVFEVVYMVGFSDAKYFRECFIKQYGYPPSQLLVKSNSDVSAGG